MNDFWDFNSKKWLYWIGWVGFVGSLQFYLWLIALILWFFLDRERIVGEDRYLLEKAYTKFAVMSGVIMLALILFLFLTLTALS